MNVREFAHGRQTADPNCKASVNLKDHRRFQKESSEANRDPNGNVVSKFNSWDGVVFRPRREEKGRGSSKAACFVDEEQLRARGPRCVRDVCPY